VRAARWSPAPAPAVGGVSTLGVGTPPGDGNCAATLRFLPRSFGRSRPVPVFRAPQTLSQRGPTTSEARFSPLRAVFGVRFVPPRSTTASHHRTPSRSCPVNVALCADSLQQQNVSDLEDASRSGRDRRSPPRGKESRGATSPIGTPASSDGAGPPLARIRSHCWPPVVGPAPPAEDGSFFAELREICPIHNVRLPSCPDS
jgi:hypothetical protein